MPDTISVDCLNAALVQMYLRRIFSFTFPESYYFAVFPFYLKHIFLKLTGGGTFTQNFDK